MVASLVSLVVVTQNKAVVRRRVNKQAKNSWFHFFLSGFLQEERDPVEENVGRG